MDLHRSFNNAATVSSLSPTGAGAVKVTVSLQLYKQHAKNT
jgi:hypothetical protein